MGNTFRWCCHTTHTDTALSPKSFHRNIEGNRSGFWLLFRSLSLSFAGDSLAVASFVLDDPYLDLLETTPASASACALGLRDSRCVQRM